MVNLDFLKLRVVENEVRIFNKEGVVVLRSCGAASLEAVVRMRKFLDAFAKEKKLPYIEGKEVKNG